MRLLVHGGSGTLVEHRALIDELATGAPLLGVTAPGGAFPDCAPADLVEVLAAGCAREVLAAGYDDVDVVGHCLGAPIALELARALSEADVTVRHLTIVSGHRIPFLLRDELVVDYAFARALGGDPAALGWPADEAAVGRALTAALTGSPPSLAPGAIGRVEGDEQVAAVAQRFRELARRDTAERRAELHRGLARSCPHGCDSAQVSEMHDAFARIVEAVTHYQPDPYAGDITFLRPIEGGCLVPGAPEDPVLFWREVCLGEVRVVDVPGDHVSCLHPQHAPRVAEAIGTAVGGR